MNNDLMEKISALVKRRGFMYPGSDLYGGLANTYDYGPMGAELLRNIRDLWWTEFIQKRGDIVGLDASLISHHKIWVASGHVASFADAMVDCKNCKLRVRADHLIEDVLEKNVEGTTVEELDKIIQDNKMLCPNCKKHEWTKVRKFNLLFPVQLGIVEGEQGYGYLRGETAQGIFINFKNVVDSTRVRLPFGMAQLGKSFRNEITPGKSVFRTVEFEQGEIEYFFNPQNQNWEVLFEQWKKAMWEFVVGKLEINQQNLRWRTHGDKERSFYSKRTEDLEYNFPFGFKELWGLAYRTDYDLRQHIQYSGKDLHITDPITNEKIIPHVIEPAVGINRILLMILCDGYTEENNRIYLRITPKLAPFKAAVFPLVANKEDLVDKAKSVYDELKVHFMIAWDDRGNIGKRYASQDEIGTPFCITIDYQTLENNSVTVRFRDTGEQKRINISEIKDYLHKALV
ncbi:MAG: glycine--tRNA ligase [Candidatus Levybacteria bacterium RIFCSPHIGHO2_12_FULL_38_12]|nr:MAG: glycine--tRNA ligase [Candidatus Levybacteria bacterium RIFCSPHIGHO2_01_FULL_38_12]OGH21793.1 MAG: glycine--tRNA ligase [Candidatus Levybacteria bacterium RIFCSPHIGHO2_02_FULL_37_18]OGH22549.1 MAG: glycine--tRNA ligase [Candidatus Levybacteria bacterium RIFCSPHIGHO2_12_FULL_38_12]OGH33414.1 MAG: glycine--tRNA ligase [Candidatus Levybacteria bacterium RIFCSPLOWO2_01_FULL_37_20]OGH44087.1 MAG: glycine--tRNA ligase [Candidatus Levybacteria bacterium RIFCSPLOWO2_02_FULL_37_18]